MRFFYRLMRSTRAATAVEYGLVLALIFLGAIPAIASVADGNRSIWDIVGSKTVTGLTGG
jgi:pilus assembly protein Flp/PilA